MRTSTWAPASASLRRAAAPLLEPASAKFVVSPNTPVRQIWVSALAKSYKLDWDIVENTFVHVESGDTLKGLIEKAISKQLHEEVSL